MTEGSYKIIGKPELIVIAKRDAHLHRVEGKIKSESNYDLTPLNEMLSSKHAVMKPLFFDTPEEAEYHTQKNMSPSFNSDKGLLSDIYYVEAPMVSVLATYQNYLEDTGNS